jgi:hypothetical protein
MDMVMHVLACDGTLMSLRTLDTADVLHVLVLSPHSLEFFLVLGEHVLLVLARDLGKDVVLVLGSLHLVGFDRLHTVLVVVYMTFFVDSW